MGVSPGLLFGVDFRGPFGRHFSSQIGPQGLHFGSILAPKSAPLGEAPGPAQYPNEYSAKLWGAGFSLKKLVRAPPGLDFGPRKSLAWSLPKASLLDPPRPLFWSDFRCFFRPPNRPPKSSRLAKKPPKLVFLCGRGHRLAFWASRRGAWGDHSGELF